MVAPSGLLSLPLDYLRNSVAQSSTFQTWTGTATEALAKARVYAVDEASPTRPCAVVDWETGWERERVALGQFMGRGSMLLVFEDDVSEAVDSDAAYDFLNNVGAVLADMELVSGTATYLDYDRMTLLDGPARPGEDERAVNDYYQVVFRVELPEL